MKTDFILYKEGSNNPIVVNESKNKELLPRCQDNWYHVRDIKYSHENASSVPYLFIHIPKTGGISFKFNVIYSPYMHKEIAVYHKFNFPPKKHAELNIFEEDKKMFTLLREPTKMVISSYVHFNHILKMNLEDFCRRYTNMQTKFLLGYDICSPYKVTEKDFEKITNLIDDKKLIVGIHGTEKMNDIYNLLELPLDKVDDYVLNKKIDVKYKLKDVPVILLQRIKKMNSFDNRLYEYVLNH